MPWKRNVQLAETITAAIKACTRPPSRASKSFQIYKLEKMTTPTTQPFESVRDLVAEKVYGARQQSEVRRFLGRLRGQALIVWKNDELKKAYDEQIRAEETPGGGH